MEPGRGVGEPDGVADEVALPHLRMPDLLGQAHLPHLRVLQHLFDAVYGRVGHARGVQGLEPVGPRPLLELGLQDGDDFVVMLPAVVAGGETGVFQEVAPPRRGHQPLPRLLVPGKMDHQGLSVRGDETVDAAPGEVLARDGLAAVQVVGHVGLDERQAGAQQRRVHELAPARVVARQQRRQDAVGGERPGGMVGDGHAHHPGPVEVGHEAQHAAQGLADGVEPRLVAIRTFLAVARDGAVDQPRVAPGQALVIEAEPGAGLRTEVLQQDVRLLQQLEERLPPLGPPQVEGQAPLVPVEGAEAGAVTLVERVPPPVRIAPVRQLHLDDVAPEVSQEAPGERPRHVPAEIDGHGSLQCRGHGSRRLPSLQSWIRNRRSGTATGSGPR